MNTKAMETHYCEAYIEEKEQQWKILIKNIMEKIQESGLLDWSKEFIYQHRWYWW
jgi:hypothetical protein